MPKASGGPRYSFSPCIHKRMLLTLAITMTLSFSRRLHPHPLLDKAMSTVIARSECKVSAACVRVNE